MKYVCTHMGHGGLLVEMPNPMLFMRLFTFLALGFLAACKPIQIGGGGITHVPPQSCPPGQALQLDIRLSASGTGAEQSTWTGAQCLYRFTPDENFTSIPMVLRNKERTAESYQVTLPPVPSTSTAVEYYFTFKFDGHPNESRRNTVPVVTP